jgi:hypothetical protein
VNDEGFVVFVSVVAFIIVAFSFVRSFVRSMRVFFRARALSRERESEREFKSENLSETSSISREWDFPGKTKHNFFKNEEQSFSLNLSSCFLSERSPPKALARDVVENVCRAFFFSRSIRDDNTPPPPPKKKKGF